MSEQEWFFEHANQTLGPFRISALQHLASVGLIHTDTLLIDSNNHRFQAQDIVDCLPTPPPPPLPEEMFRCRLPSERVDVSTEIRESIQSSFTPESMFRFLGCFVPSAATIGSEVDPNFRTTD
ncbi:hypothetical protein GC197_16620 [bacterium]|nr:hypothetical protein [bacterium]